MLTRQIEPSSSKLRLGDSQVHDQAATYLPKGPYLSSQGT